MSPTLPKKTFLALNRMLGHSSAKNHMTKPRIGDIENLNDDHQRNQLRVAYEKHEKEQRRKEKLEQQAYQRNEEEKIHASDPEAIRKRYGSVNFGDVGPSFKLRELSTAQVGKVISFTARLHHIRSMSAQLLFVLLRQELYTIQGVLQHRDGAVSDHFIHWTKHLHAESLVYVEGQVRAPPVPVKECSFHDVEILVESLHLLVPIDKALPVDSFGIDRVETNGVDEPEHGDPTPHLAASLRVREANRIVFLRTPAMQSIFRINAAVCSLFRATLESQGFIEVHTPKLQPAATESGAEVFPVRYFGRKAFLAQSPQLAKQMTISADFDRVFEIGPVFRAEDSNTHRHLTEYTGLDLEMALHRHYHEALDLIDNLLKTIFKGIYERHRREIEMIRTRFPHEDLVWLDKTPRLSFKEGVALLNESAFTDESGNPIPDKQDLNTKAEIRLGQLVKEKYNTDYYILDKFPTSARPFYTHLDPDDEEVTNSFDIFIRGQEIVTGGQRINNPHLLARRMEEADVDVDGLREYMHAFECGAPPHAGCGIGLERLLFLFLDLGDIRNASLFPRDPKSLADRVEEKDPRLPHPDADTIRYGFAIQNDKTKPELPTVEELIANYGDATNTSWLDDHYEIWRDESTGAAIGYASVNGYALIMGNPLCDERQYSIVISTFLKDLRKQKDLRPIWLLVSHEVQEILGTQLGWQTMSCVAEERVEISNHQKISKKERQAENADLKIHELPPGTPLPKDLRSRVDKRIEDWKASRSNKRQVHLTEVRPWVDIEHRMFLWSEDKDGEIAGLCVLHRLAPRYGYQVKFALDFPGAPSGGIEALISRAIESLAKLGVRSVTFGAGASPTMEIGQNVHRVRAKIVARTYRHIVAQLKLVAKSDFRKKFGAQDCAVYICYPTLGLGVSGARTLIKFFEDDI